MLLEEPLPAQRLATDPIQKVSIYLRPNRLHEIAGEAVALAAINVQNTESGIEPECSDG